MTATEPNPTAEHIDAVALDLDAVEAEFLRQCGGCDAGLMVGCTCSQRDFRPTMLALVAEVRRLTRLGQCDLDLLMRAESAEAEVVTLRAQVNGLHEELLRGDPDVVTLRARLAAVEAERDLVRSECDIVAQHCDMHSAEVDDQGRCRWVARFDAALAVTTGEGE